MELERKYNTATDIYFPLIKRGVTDFAVSADFTHSAGDTKISKDGGAAANTTNAPTAITMGNGAMWKLTLTATEMQAAKVMVTIVDTATKAVEDQMILITTYGNASAEHAFDRSQAEPNVNVTKVNSTSQTARDLGAQLDAAVSSRMASYTQPTGFLAATFPGTVASTTNITAATGVVLSGAGVQAIWDAATTALTTVGSIGKRLADDIDAAISSRSTYAGGDTSGTTTLLSRIGSALTITSGKVDVNDKTGFSLSSAGVQAIWDAATSALTTAGSIGKLLVDNINATISSRLASASYTAPDNSTISAIAGYVDTEVGALQTAVAALPTANANADALLDRAAGIETNRTLRQGLRLMLAAVLGKASGLATTSVIFRDTNDTKDRITATVDASGNRTAVTLDAS